MFQKRLKKYIAQGGKYAYAWIEKDDVAAINSRFCELKFSLGRIC